MNTLGVLQTILSNGISKLWNNPMSLLMLFQEQLAFSCLSSCGLLPHVAASFIMVTQQQLPLLYCNLTPAAALSSDLPKRETSQSGPHSSGVSQERNRMQEVGY
jgi:hypothetical protein